MAKIHRLKIHTRYYRYVENRIRNAEVRFYDKDYKTGDCLVLEEWNGSELTGHAEVREVTGVFPLDDVGLKNYVLISMK